MFLARKRYATKCALRVTQAVECIGKAIRTNLRRDRRRTRPDTPRQGFAANYAGLITITGLLGRCELPNRVTPSQLQHHHWVLARIDGAELEIKDADSLPDLAIGEQMQVSGNSECNNFRGAASLADHQFKIEQMASTQRLHTPARNEIERTVTALLSSASSASLDANRNLTSANGEHDLHWTLAD